MSHLIEVCQFDPTAGQIVICLIAFAISYGGGFLRGLQTGYGWTKEREHRK